MLVSFAGVLAYNLQTVKEFGTVIFLFIFIFGACILNFELFIFSKEKTHILALLSFLLGLAAFSIPAAPIGLGILTHPLILFLSLGSVASGISFIIINKRKANTLNGNSAAFTGILMSAVLFLMLLPVAFYSPEKHYYRGIEYYDAGKYDQAILEYNKATKVEPQMFDAYYRRGLAYAQKGDYDNALSDYNRTIQTFFWNDPNNAAVYSSRAEAYLYKHEYEKAWEDVHKAESLDSKLQLPFIEALKKASGREK